MSKFVAISIAVAITAIAAAASAGGTEDRVANLERQVALIQRTNTNNNAEVASSLSRMGAITDEFAAVKGAVEANEHLVKTQYDEIHKRIVDLDQRVAAIEDRLSIFSSSLTKALGKVAPEAAAEGEAYQKALDLASNSQYLEAASAFSAFIAKFPKSSYVASATYWIGECFYSMRDYQRAIKEYQNYVSKFPRDEKVPEAMVKQGNGFYELGLLDEARIFYDKVISTYPRSAAAATAQAQLAKLQKRKAGAAAPAPGANAGAYPTETLEQQMQRRVAVPPADMPMDPASSDLAPEKKGQAGGKTAPAAQPKPAPKAPIRDF